MSTNIARFAVSAVLFWTGCSTPVKVANAQQSLLGGALIRLTVGGTAALVVIKLASDRPLEGQLQTVGTPPTRLFIDLPSIVPEVPNVTDVNLGAVRRIRVALNQAQPPVTRVVLDVDSMTTYALKQGSTRNELQISVESASSRPTHQTETYSEWFSRTVSSLIRLLEEAIGTLPRARSDLSSTERLELEWNVLGSELSAVIPPSNLKVAHELLVTASTIGRVAITAPIVQLADSDVRSAATGATMLARYAERIATPQLIQDKTSR